MRGWVWQTVLIEKINFLSLLASLASGGVVSWLGPSVAGRNYGGFVVVARFLEAMGASGRLGSTTRSCLMCLLMFGSCRASLILRWGVVEAP